MENKTDFKFSSLEEVKAHYPLIRTATLHTVRPLPRLEVAGIQIAQAKARGIWADYIPRENADMVEIIELRGSLVADNLAPCAPQDTGAIYINHSYDPAIECWQDFVENDLVTILYGMVDFPVNRNLKMQSELHAICIFNHETRAMVPCHDNFVSRPPLYIPQPWPSAATAHHRSEAIAFLWENNLIPQSGNQPRPLNDLITNFPFSNAPAAGSCLVSCGRIVLLFILVVALLIGLLWVYEFFT